MIHLRTRTEYSFRTCYGPVERVAERLAEIGCSAAGIVDTRGTWGHVSWEKALDAVGITPIFGAELVLPTEDGRKPRAWAVAEDLASFYRFTSSAPETPQAWAGAKGVIRFAGEALDDPECFDYIDLNPRSRRATERSLELAKRTGKPIVITGDNDYPGPEDRERFLAWDDSSRATPQHIMTEAELRGFFGDDLFEIGLHNAWEIEERTRGQKLRRAPVISVGKNAPRKLAAECSKGAKYRVEAGHIPEWTSEYEERLRRELDMIREKSYDSYFLVVSDLVRWAKTRMLVGPARGSSAGSLVCYLLQITEVDPLVHDLLFERFIDINRHDLPDIDIDFNDRKRDEVFEYLGKKYGRANVAHIGNVLRLKPKSVMAHVGKKLGIPYGATLNVLNVLIEYSSGDSRYGKGLEDTLANTEPGRQFMERYPEAALMGELENHASHTGVHAAGIIVSNEPVIEYCTVLDGVAQVDKRDAEYLNLLKIDALGLRTLGVIEDAGVVSADELYGMRLDDPEVFSIFNDKRYSGLFQFEGAAQRRVSGRVPIKSFQQIDHVTALARPGPMMGGAADFYVLRNRGDLPLEYHHPSMEAYLGETMGVAIYQEQVMKIVREIGRFTWEETSTIRKAMSGRKGKEFFDRYGEKFAEGAATLGIDAETAGKIWVEICNFGSWGMNKSHTTSYAIISYWCAYLKRYHPLEYAAACLRSAKDDEQAVEILRELNAEGIPFVPFDPDLSDVNWTARDGRLIGGFTNLVGIGPVKARHYVEKRERGELTDADREKLAKYVTKHNDLSPAHTLWGDYYAHPENYNIRGRVRELADLEDRENAVVIGKLCYRKRRDKNEKLLVGKRGYEMKGQTQFLDLFIVDDSISRPVIARVNPKQWKRIGERIADRAVDGQDWFLIRGKWLSLFSLLSIDKIKCLTNGDVA